MSSYCYWHLVSAWQTQGYLSFKTDFFIIWVPGIKFRPLFFQGKCFADRTTFPVPTIYIMYMCVHTYMYVFVYTYSYTCTYIPFYSICENIIASLFVFMGCLWVQTVCLCISFSVFFLAFVLSCSPILIVLCLFYFIVFYYYPVDTCLFFNELQKGNGYI